MTYSEAYAIALKFHSGQVRKFGGGSYLDHPKAVADKFTDEDHKILSILHDVIEDTNMTIERLVSEYHLAEHIARALEFITRRKNQNYLGYLQRFQYNDLAREVKIEDIKHNMSDLKPGCMYQKYEIALYILEFVIPNQIRRGL